MDGWSPFVNERGVDQWDSMPPLVETQPFDTWVHCLNCHETGYGFKDTHQFFECEQPREPSNHAPRGENLLWARNLPRTGETTALMTLVNIIGEGDTHDDDFEAHVRRRDNLYIRISDEMRTRFPEAVREPWREAMSAFHVLTSQFCIRRVLRPRAIIRQALGDHMLQREDQNEFLRRVAEAEGILVPFEDFEMPLQRIRTSLGELNEEFDVMWRDWERLVYEFLDTNVVMLNLDIDDAEWMTKAFNVMLKTQPKLKCHAEDLPKDLPYFIFPDVEQVARDEGLDV